LDSRRVRTHTAVTVGADFETIAVPADAASLIGVHEQPETARHRVERQVASDDDKTNSAIAGRTSSANGALD